MPSNTEVLLCNAITAKKTAALLRAGGVAVLPTETVYGLAASCESETGIAEIFRVKNRPADNPLIMHCDGIDMALRYAAECTDEIKRLANAFWPGPLTIVTKHLGNVLPSVTAGQNTVALRVPDNDFFKEVIGACGCPLVAPSANISGKPSPTTASEALKQLNSLVNIIADGGECRVGVESTIIYLSKDKAVLLRPGDITTEQLAKVLNRDILFEHLDNKEESTDKTVEKSGIPTAPGMKYRHYAPDCEIILYTGKDFISFVNNLENTSSFGIMCFDEEVSKIDNDTVVSYGGEHDEKAQQRTLFVTLSSLDSYGKTMFYVHTKKDFKAVYNRLYKASQGKEINI